MVIVAEERRNSGRSSKPAARGGRPQRDGKPAAGAAGKGGARGATGKPGAKSSSAGTGRGAAPAGGKRTGTSSGSSSARPYGKSGDDRRGSGPRSTTGAGPRNSAPARPFREREPRAERTDDQRAYDGPDLPESITGKELDRSVAAQLRGLPEKLANRVARHLVAASLYVDSNPELAYQHAKAAKSRTQRIAVVREALGETAYAAGHYEEALAELRAAKRMNGATAYLPIMADCHRALGHPDQAIKLAHSPSVKNFIPEAKAEMTIVEAGARRDMGQFDAALRLLELAPLNSKSRSAWVVRLRYTYADTLEAAGRPAEALEWFHRTHAIDGEEITDAAVRAEDLERRVPRSDS
jgi:hypothetical protein